MDFGLVLIIEALYIIKCYLYVISLLRCKLDALRAGPLRKVVCSCSLDFWKYDVFFPKLLS